MKKIITVLAVAAIFVISAHGQGFLNLNFESAYNLPGNPGNGALVSVTNALPDWTAYNGPNVLADIYYVSNTLGYAQNVELEGGSLALSGNNFSVGLYGSSSISQMGLVPGNAESLQFEAAITDNALSVTLGGQSLSFSALSEGTGYTVYGANIPADMDGLTEALIFSVQGPSAGTILDNIGFISPEPSEYALLGLGALLFSLLHLHKKNLSRLRSLRLLL